MELTDYTDNLEQAVNEVTHFYDNFHSIRYHREDLIIRLQWPQCPTPDRSNVCTSRPAESTNRNAMGILPMACVEQDRHGS